MKYIISESQYQLLLESKIPSWVRRRATKEVLTQYISKGEVEYGMLCEDFDTESEYSAAVIRYAIESIIKEHDSNFYNIFANHEYDDVYDYLRLICKKYFEENLKNIYIETCGSE